VQLVLAPGDTVLITTHGFMRRNNREGIELGLEKARRIFEDVAPKTHPDRIIERLTTECDGWAEGLPAQDDMSFIVLRKRS
jgi:serine phosphatase RsbU (regulator of sigma subunit)